jgi:hypothetical protein
MAEEEQDLARLPYPRLVTIAWKYAITSMSEEEAVRFLSCMTTAQMIDYVSGETLKRLNRS